MNSIRRKLIVWLLAAVLVAGLTAAWGVYRQARAELDEVFDYHLRQMALSLRDGSFGAAAVDPGEIASEFDFAIQIWSREGVRIYFSRPDAVLPNRAYIGYANVGTRDGLWRVFGIQARDVVIQVAQPMQLRDRLAAGSALRTLLPFLLLLPVLGLAVWITVGRELRPLESVARAVRSRDAGALEPLPSADLPEEVSPLVNELNDLLARLGRALTAQRDFVADAAHELRTPLAALRLQMQLAERAASEAERGEAFAALSGGLERATRVVGQLLTLARQEPDGAPQKLEAVDLAALARSVVADRSLLAEAKAVDLGVADAEAQRVQGDPDALRIALSNLVDNALRHTPRGGRVDVGVRREGEVAVLEVIDDGPGIPAAERERVFDRFYRRADAAEAGGGGGLGLAIVRGIAQRHGATVALEDGPAGRGLAARLRIPASI